MIWRITLTRESLVSDTSCLTPAGDHLRTAISIAHLCGITPPDMPVLLVDGSSPDPASYASITALAAATATSTPEVPPGWSLLVLRPDGALQEVASTAAAAADVVSGQMQCAVTGKGFNR